MPGSGVDGYFRVPWGTPEGLEGPQRAAMSPTWRANGLRTAKLAANDGSGEGHASGSAPPCRSRPPRLPERP